MARKIIYLDQNKWIDLARAYHGHRDGGPFREVLDAASAAVKRGDAVFPLSSSHFIETAGEKDAARRDRLAEVMVLLSQCLTIRAPRRLVGSQVRNGIRHVLGESIESPEDRVFGFGPFIAFEAEYPPRNRVVHPLVARMVCDHFCSAAGMREMLSMPDDSLRQAGVQSVAATAIRLVEHAEVVRANERSPEIRRRTYVASLMLHFYDDVIEVLIETGRTKDDLFRLGPDRLSTFIDHCPVLQIETELAMLRDAHTDRAIQANDSRDIAHAQVAIPYCDEFVTEKFLKEMCLRAGLNKRYSCCLHNDVRELVPTLSNCSQAIGSFANGC